MLRRSKLYETGGLSPHTVPLVQKAHEKHDPPKDDIQNLCGYIMLAEDTVRSVDEPRKRMWIVVKTKRWGWIGDLRARALEQV